MKLKNKKIQKWIKLEILPNLIKTINRNYTSYTLKHICENDLGFYVSNEDIKENMSLLGICYEKAAFSDVNHCYPISQKWFNSKKTQATIGGTNDKKRA